MTALKSHGKFRDNAQYNPKRETVDFTLEWYEGSNHEIIVCRVSRAALEDRAGSDGRTHLLVLYERLKQEVWSAVENRRKGGKREADGSLLICSGEVIPLA